jgi:predicted enzyme related to lactoylglutathione lyase
MPVTGPDFISLQVRDLERSATFYEQHMGLSRSPKGPPHAVVFDTRPAAFAVREVVPGVDLDSVPRPGLGTALWLHATDAQDLHDTLAAAGTPITSAPVDGPFGRTFTFADPDGYLITIHDQA